MDPTLAADAPFWDKLAERYAAKPLDDPEAFQRKVEVTTARMSPDSVVLDVGCGTGSLALILASHGAHIHGLDVSSEMLRIAGEKTADAGVSNVSFHQGTLDTFSALEPGSLDVVCAYSLLHLVRDRAATLARLYALLKPGGAFVSSTVCLGDGWVPYGLILPAMRLVGQAPRVSILAHAQLDREIAEAGFVDVQAPDVGAKSDIAFRVARKPG